MISNYFVFSDWKIVIILMTQIWKHEITVICQTMVFWWNVRVFLKFCKWVQNFWNFESYQKLTKFKNHQNLINDCAKQYRTNLPFKKFTKPTVENTLIFIEGFIHIWHFTLQVRVCKNLLLCSKHIKIWNQCISASLMD